MTPDDIWSLPTAHIGRRVWWFGQLGSTNDLARQLAPEPDHDGLAVIAHEQTAGRGQYGRTWLTPAGTAVLMSVIVRPPAAFARPVLLTAWAAVAACETIQELTGQSARIKWPNDVYLHGRKVCGILIEGHGRAIVAGLGLNVNQTSAEFEAADLPEAGSLASLTGGSWPVADVARRLLHGLDESYRLLAAGDAVALESAWQERLGLAGCMVRLRGFADETWTGRLNALSFTGVRLATPEGPRTFAPETVRQVSLVPEP